jgi:1-acyl-sn-glycerol-3-phosphate acyltransferase
MTVEALSTLGRGVRLVGRALFAGISEEKFFREALGVVDLILEIRPRVHSWGAERVQALGPTLFACNHVGIFDPIYLIHEVYLATKGRKRCAQIMRDDYFKLSWINRRMVLACNTIPFPRGGLNPSKLEGVLTQVREHLDHGVILFVAGTRSRSGEVMYVYRKCPGSGRGEEAKAPGRILQVLVKGVRAPLSVVPTTLTYDFSTKQIHVVFGMPVEVTGKEDAQEAAQIVRRVVAEIENQVWVGPQHLIPCLLHHPFLEGREAGVPLPWARECLHKASEGLARVHAYMEEDLRRDFGRAFDKALAWYRSKGTVQIRGERLVLDKAALERLDHGPRKSLRDALPSLFYWNQVKHLKPLMAVLQETIQAMIHEKG